MIPVTQLRKTGRKCIVKDSEENTEPSIKIKVYSNELFYIFFRCCCRSGKAGFRYTALVAKRDHNEKEEYGNKRFTILTRANISPQLSNI